MLQEVQSNVHPDFLEFVNVSSCEPHLYTHTRQIDLHIDCYARFFALFPITNVQVFTQMLPVLPANFTWRTEI